MAVGRIHVERSGCVPNVLYAALMWETWRVLGPKRRHASPHEREKCGL